ncbi:hypothetical protein AAEX28_13795 [Lentisphaerota bacterium WC36G]|nr:hypothetical protein LJT99_00545 [Lentisphaerae bacterium WC36]
MKKIFLALSILGSLLTISSCAVNKEYNPQKHKFILSDESRKQVLQVDLANTQNDWIIKLNVKSRDLQLIADNKLLISTDNGYREIDRKSLKTTKKFNGKFRSNMNAIRLDDGSTILAGNSRNGINIYKLDKNDKIIKHINFPQYRNIRLLNIDNDGKLMFGCNNNHVVISDFSKKIYHDITVAGARHIYEVQKLANGNILVANGYGQNITEINLKNNKVVKEYGGKNHPQAQKLGFHFFSGMQLMKNGNIIVANWTGHGANDSNKGVQLIEFSPNNKVIWHWKNPRRTGSVHNVIVLD